MASILQGVETSKTLSQLTTNKRQIEDRLNSGGVKETFVDAKDPARFLAATADLSQLENIKNTNNQLVTRQKNIEVSLKEAFKINQQLYDTVHRARTPRMGPDPAFRDKVKFALQNLTEILNRKDENGNSLFAGTAHNKDAVQDLTSLGGVSAGDPANFNYYTGGKSVDEKNIGLNKNINIAEISANDPVFEKTIRAARILLNTALTKPEQGNPNNASLDKALDLLQENNGSTGFPDLMQKNTEKINHIENNNNNIDHILMVTNQQIHDSGVEDQNTSLEKYIRSEAQLDTLISFTSHELATLNSQLEKMMRAIS